MEISVISLGPLETNCYVVSDEARKLCAVVDPGDDGPQLAETLRSWALRTTAIFLTHGHHDHVGGVRALHEATGAPVYLHEAELALPASITDGPLFYTDFYREGDRLSVGALRFDVLHTPGHSPGSVCLRCGQTLLAGDTLFRGSCGRVDLPLGSWSDMLHSLARLSALEGDLSVRPGHGEATTLAWERQHNPYLREAIK